MPGMLLAELVDVLRPEHLVDAAVALARGSLGWRGSLPRVLPPKSGSYGSHTGICSSGMPMPQRRVAAQVLIGEEQHAAASAAKAHFEHGLGVARRADDAAVPADRTPSGWRPS